MSDDLISRNELWEETAKLEELARKRVLDTPTSSPCYQRYNTQLNERTNLKHIIADAKIAYDVDKVVEQIGELKQFRLNLADAMSEIQKYGPGRRYVCLEDVVKILEGGGVDE